MKTVSSELYTSEARESRRKAGTEKEVADPDKEKAKKAIEANVKEEEKKVVDDDGETD
jgi:hypothetical protein